MNKVIITNVSKVLLIALLFQFTVPVNAESVKLKNRTRIQLSLYHTIYGKTARIGQPVIFKLLHDIEINNKIVLPAGSKATGEIIYAKGPGLFGKPGSLSIKVKSVQAIDGSNVPLSGSLSLTGKSRVVIALILTLWVFGFLIKGGDASIQKGTIIRATTIGDVEIEVD